MARRRPVSVVPDAEKLDPKGTTLRALERAAVRKKAGAKGKKAARSAPKAPHRGRRRREDKSTGQYYTTQPGPLTPQGHTYNRGHNEAVKTMTVALRKAKATELLVVQQWSYQQIADELGVSTAQVARDLQDSFRELNEQRLQDIEHRRLLEIARTERADRKLLPGLEAKDARVRNQTADALRSNAEFRARLDGLYAKNDGAWTSEAVVAFVLGFTRDLLAEFTEDDQKRRIRRVYVKHASLELPDIDISPAPSLTTGGDKDERDTAQTTGASTPESRDGGRPAGGADKDDA